MSETYTNLLQWLVILAFFLLVVGAMFVEAFWLSKKGWTNFGRGFVFAAVSNIIGFAIGLGVFMIVMMIFIMLSLDGTTQRIFDSEIGGPTAIATLVFATFLTPILLIICKRVFLGILKIQTGKTAWLYALVSSILILVIALGVPMVAGYFAFT